MANNYVGFSFALPIEDSAKQTQAMIWLSMMDNLLCDDEYVPDPEDGPIPQWIVDWTGNQEMYRGFGFMYDCGDSGIVFYHEDGGDVDQVAEVVHLLVKHLELPPVGFTWSTWCEKPRLHEFWGGAVYITQDKVSFWSGHNWLREQNLAARQKKDPA